MICSRCDNDVNPVTEFKPPNDETGDPGGMIKTCPLCSLPLADVTERAWSTQKPASTPEPLPACPVVTSRAEPAPTKTFDVVKAAKARLRYVTKEHKRLEKELKAAAKEKAQLTRLLKAAETPSNLRAINAAGS